MDAKEEREELSIGDRRSACVEGSEKDECPFCFDERRLPLRVLPPCWMPLSGNVEVVGDCVALCVGVGDRRDRSTICIGDATSTPDIADGGRASRLRFNEVVLASPISIHGESERPGEREDLTLDLD